LPHLHLDSISKSFDGVKALDEASISVPGGTVHALLGENGAGKTTLMRVAFGMVQPDAGTIQLDGAQKQFASPANAIAAGIGMVHQHFALVHAMTVAENIALGGAGLYDARAAITAVEQLCAETGLMVNPRAKVSELGVAGQQRVEILKALSRNARILILDEPTAVLPPTEARSLLDWVRGYANGDRSAVLITHKVREALRIADHVTVLRHGRSVFSGITTDTTEVELAQIMVEQSAMPSESRAFAPASTSVASLENVSVSTGDHQRLISASLIVRQHEIVGVAGVEGSGYRELLRVLAGTLAPSAGVQVGPASIGFVPEDRHQEALALDMTAAENVAMHGLGRCHGLLAWTSIRENTRSLAIAYDVRGPLAAPVRQLSGGNQQKLVVARELGDDPELVVAENPTRGLDVNATAAVHERLRAARDRGAAVVVYSSDLEELFALADRIVVTYAGKAHEVPLQMEAVTRALVGLPV
jgi:general nucleoside transport system ATP-binding protein